MDPSRIERSGAAGTRRRFVASLLFGRQRASLYVAYGLGVVLSAMALGVPDLVSAASFLSSHWSNTAVAQGSDKSPTQSESDTPFDEAEQTSDPNESSRGEERPESDGAKGFMDGRGVTVLAVFDFVPEPVGSLRPAHEVALESQFHPDGLERPPRA